MDLHNTDDSCRITVDAGAFRNRKGQAQTCGLFYVPLRQGKGEDMLYRQCDAGVMGAVFAADGDRNCIIIVGDGFAGGKSL